MPSYIQNATSLVKTSKAVESVRVFVLAMHYRLGDEEKDCDTMRLNSLMRNAQCESVIAAAWGTGETTVAGFLPCDFRTQIPRSFQYINPHIVLLDYFFLVTNYYESNYGTNWLTDKVPSMFRMSIDLEVVILPIDKLQPNSMEDEFKQWKLDQPKQTEYQELGLHVHSLSIEEAEQCHPLVVASICIEERVVEKHHLDTWHGRSHSVQKERYLHLKGAAFYCISKCESRLDLLSKLAGWSRDIG